MFFENSKHRFLVGCTKIKFHGFFTGYVSFGQKQKQQIDQKKIKNCDFLKINKCNF